MAKHRREVWGLYENRDPVTLAECTCAGAWWRCPRHRPNWYAKYHARHVIEIDHDPDDWRYSPRRWFEE